MSTADGAEGVRPLDSDFTARKAQKRSQERTLSRVCPATADEARRLAAEQLGFGCLASGKIDAGNHRCFTVRVGVAEVCCWFFGSCLIAASGQVDLDLRLRYSHGGLVCVV
jgi:hypothetical protein